ncbi:MAG: SMR family transporter [Actinomycetota bacterium]|nr:SMR family transporter [Actinomycetota bacterium]
MLLATILSLTAAVMHASWNFVAKRAEGDRYLVLWAQFFAAGVISLPLLVANHLIWGMPWQGYLWAACSGLVHLPYLSLLARAYTHADFSVSYPVARGGGAALAAIAGVAFLGDHLSVLEVAGIAIVIGGLTMLAYGANGAHLALALLVAVTIGLYSTLDAHGARLTHSVAYIFATQVAGGLVNTTYALARGRRAGMVEMLRRHWRRAAITGLATMVTYGLVLVAFDHAPVGYVSALRESSVVLAALAGWKFLGEGDHRRRIAAALVVFSGLLVLVFGH